MMRSVSLLVAGLFVALSAGATPTGSTALYSDTRALAVDSFTGATFSPNPAATPITSLVGGVVRVQWGRVVSDSGTPVDYEVRRSGSDGSESTVCAATGAIVLSGSTLTCDDTAVLDGISYSYTVRSRLVRDGAITWTGITSASSAPLTVNRTRFAGVGPLVTSVSSGPMTVPYPTGTRVGDLLVLVVEVGRNKGPVTPTGWTALASRSITGADDFHLYVAQRIADGSGSVTVDVDARNGGALSRVVRYEVPVGASTPMVVATTAQDGSTTGATSQFTPSPDLRTSGAAVALAIVATRGGGSIGLSATHGWTLRDSVVATPSTVPLGFAIADAVVARADTVASPTWSLSSGSSRWIYWGSAFG